jgi:hypothetical protein
MSIEGSGLQVPAHNLFGSLAILALTVFVLLVEAYTLCKSALRCCCFGRGEGPGGF